MSDLEKRQADTRDAIARGMYVCDGAACPLPADECGCCDLLGSYKPPAEREQQDTDAREEGLDASDVGQPFESDTIPLFTTERLMRFGYTEDQLLALHSALNSLLGSIVGATVSVLQREGLLNDK